MKINWCKLGFHKYNKGLEYESFSGKYIMYECTKCNHMHFYTIETYDLDEVFGMKRK